MQKLIVVFLILRVVDPRIDPIIRHLPLPLEAYLGELLNEEVVLVLRMDICGKWWRTCRNGVVGLLL